MGSTFRWNPSYHGKQAEPRNFVLRLGAELILNGFRPSDGIQFVMAKKLNPEILCCAPREVAEPILNGFRLQMESNLSWQKSRTQKFWVVPL